LLKSAALYIYRYIYRYILIFFLKSIYSSAISRNRNLVSAVDFIWGSGIKTHSLGGACIGDTGSELQLYVVVYCTHIELD